MDAAIEYRKYGVTDNDTIIKSMKMEHGNETNWANKDRIAAAKLSGVSKSTKDLNTNMEQFAKTPGVTQQQVNDMRRRIKYLNDIN